MVLGCARSEPATQIPTLAPTKSLPLGTANPTVLPCLQVWRPGPGTTSWQWQLNDLPIDHSIDAEMYDIDLFENDAATVAELHAEGPTVICYINAGGWENWRPDTDQFPETIIGANLDDWAGEMGLGIRNIEILAPILETRMDLCKLKGFDGVEPDNVDGYLNETGFPLSYDDQLRYNIWLADAAHKRGLSNGLKNDMDQIPDLLPHFDWALNEECFQFNECETLVPFINAGHADFNVEYGLETHEFCDKANALGFNSLKKNLGLDAWQEPCD